LAIVRQPAARQAPRHLAASQSRSIAPINGNSRTVLDCPPSRLAFYAVASKQLAITS